LIAKSSTNKYELRKMVKKDVDMKLPQVIKRNVVDVN
jgi:hypothetical protein